MTFHRLPMNMYDSPINTLEMEARAEDYRKRADALFEERELMVERGVWDIDSSFYTNSIIKEENLRTRCEVWRSAVSVLRIVSKLVAK